MIKKPTRSDRIPKEMSADAAQPLGIWFWAENVSPVPTSDHSEAMPAELKWSLSELARRFSIIEAGKVVPHAVDQRLMRDGLGSPSLVFLASNSRVDGLSDSVKQIAERYPGVPIQLVLGEYWTGHRRTQPMIELPSIVSTSYWYQTHDVLVPATQDCFCVQAVKHSNSQVLIVSDHASNRRLWLDLLAALGSHGVAAHGESDLPEGNFSVVIVDNLRECSPELVAKIRCVYPEVVISVGFGFPAWSLVEPCLVAGADIIFGKPFQFPGLVRSFSSAALARK